MSDVMMQLGSFQFSLPTATYQDLSRTTTYKWAAQAQLGGRDALQFTGRNDKIEVSGVVFPEWRGGTGQLDRMRAEADKKEPLIMVDGRGNVLGLWVILTVSEQQGPFADAGAPLKQQFRLSLQKVSDGTIL